LPGHRDVLSPEHFLLNTSSGCDEKPRTGRDEPSFAHVNLVPELKT
jgi:hypothetical protein